MNHRTHASSLLLLLVSANLVLGQEPSGKIAIPVLQSVDAAMQRFVDQGQVSGAVTLVARGGKVVHLGAVGLAEIESEKQMQTHKMFSIASMTKPVTATAVMILQDEGKLNIDDNISKYLPEYKNVKLQNGSAPNREITIRDVVTHTSGLAGNQVFDSSLKDAVDQLATQPLKFQPGTKWQYSPGLNVAGRVVEVVAGKPFEEFVQQRIFDPLKMTNTSFFPNDKQQARIAGLYRMDGQNKTLAEIDNRIVDPSNVKAPNPSGGLFSTARDMFRFYQMILSGGQLRRGDRIVSEQAVKEMTQPQTGDLVTGFTPGNCWGLGWCIVREPQGVTESLSSGTFGHGGAFGTQGWVDPETQTIYVLMIQRADLPNSDGSGIRKSFHKTASEALGL
ncbi:MAG: beta-lactamase family protein [Planctomycetaceae bacterium]|nr:beta-lactamase family protein [Planctomycetaceae bacterium]